MKKLLAHTQKALLLLVIFSSFYLALQREFSLLPLIILCVVALGCVIALSPLLQRTSALLLILTLALTLLLLMGVVRALDTKSLTWSLPVETLAQVEGTLLSDSSITSNGETVLQCQLISCRDRRGKKASARGVITLLIRGEHLLFWPATIRVDDLTVHENLIVAQRVEEISQKQAFWQWRYYLYQLFNHRLANLTPLATDLARQLLLGKSDQDSILTRTLAVASGSAHVLALSGMHVTLLALCTTFFFKPLLSRQGALVASSVVVLFFLYLAGPKPSLVRSALMFFMLQFGGEGKAATTALILAFLLQLWVTPAVATSAAMTLSYASLAAILLSVPIASPRLALLVPPSLASLVVTSSGALAATAPISLMLFGAWYPVGIVFSPLLALVVSAIMLGSLFYLAIPLPWIASCLDYLCKCFVALAFRGSRWSETHSKTTGVDALLVFYLLMLTLFLLLSYARTQIAKRSRKRNNVGFSLRFKTSSHGTHGEGKLSSE